MTNQNPHTEEQLIEFVRSISVTAPASLHERVDALVAERSGAARTATPRRSPLAWRLAGATSLAVVAIVAIVLATGGGHGGLSVSEATALTLRPATMPAPRESSTAHRQLASAVDGVAFPYWGERFGWRSSGARSDRVHGRAITTVFYSNAAGQRIGYAIVGGSPPPHPANGSVRWRGGTSYRVSTQSGSEVVTWVRDGHLCVVAGRGVASATLLRLASWDDVPASS